MKKAFSVVLALVMALSLVACGGSSAKGAVKTGLGIVATGAIKSEADADANGKAQSNTTVAAVLVDAEGKILDCKLDVAQTTTEYTTQGEVKTTEDFRTKMEKGADYGMAGASAIKKEWNEQAEAFAAYVVGKTADEVAAIPQLGADKHNAPDVADLTASCTMDVTDFKAAVVAAAKNAKEMGAQAGDKLGLGVTTTMPVFSNKSASADGDGAIQHDTTAAVTTTKDGKITSTLLNAVQTKYTVTTEGTAECTTATATSKQELGANYGMVGASAIKKEWNEQADAFAAYTVGKTAAEVEAIPQLGADKHNGPDVADLAASCTIDVTDFKAALAKAAA